MELRPWLILIPTYNIAKIAKIALGIEPYFTSMLIMSCIALAIETLVLLKLAVINEYKL